MGEDVPLPGQLRGPGEPGIRVRWLLAVYQDGPGPPEPGVRRGKEGRLPVPGPCYGVPPLLQEAPLFHRLCPRGEGPGERKGKLVDSWGGRRGWAPRYPASSLGPFQRRPYP